MTGDFWYQDGDGCFCPSCDEPTNSRDIEAYGTCFRCKDVLARIIREDAMLEAQDIKEEQERSRDAIAGEAMGRDEAVHEANEKER